ncbi:DUF4320 family protein [Paenibacillus amylolyticus]|uniref:DUF4320 family protein n=1 Tax=Paenibacillus amylolyticus TaxID=1451 RepID=A0ABD8B2Q3_PAEAM
MIKKLKQFKRSERGDGWLWLLFSILIFTILGLISVSIVNYQMTKSNVKTAANETLQIMKVENGSTEATRQRFNTLLTKMGIDPARVEFEATPQMVQRGDALEITARVKEYEIIGLKAIGVNYKTSIEVHSSGLAHKYIRKGD